jgi:hypothetical protein
MKNDFSKAQIDEFRQRDSDEDPRAPVDIGQPANWSTVQSAQEVVRVSKAFYFSKAQAQGCG